MKGSLGLITFLAITTAARADPPAPVQQRCAQGDKVNLAPADRARLDAALPRAPSGRIARCAERDGASCDTSAYLLAFNRTGPMPRFLASICGQPQRS